MRRIRDERGQVLAGVIAILVIALTLIPLMVLYTQHEATWTARQAESTTAFHMAESGVEKAYLQISLSTLNWVNLQNGTLMTDFKFDKSFSDVSGGNYALSITSGPGNQQATVISIGRDARNQQVRAIKAIYANATVGNVAIEGGSGVDVSGNNLTVEWGAIVSPGPITPNGEAHPSYWSADNIVGFDANGSTPPNCDSPNCWWWHSYYAGIPPMPAIDFDFYRSSAQASTTGVCSATCSLGMTGRYCPGNMSGGCNDTSGKPYFVEGDWTGFDGPIKGSIIVMGNMTTPNGAMSGSAVSASVPQQAWKQYCNDWAFYKTNYEPTNVMAACPGQYSSYLSPAANTFAITPVVNGLLYVGGDFSGPNGGGNTDLGYGVLVVNGTVHLNSNSHCKWYYNASVSQGLQTTTISLSRQSWQDVILPWPSGL